jgi:hypothetical protein
MRRLQAPPVYSKDEQACAFPYGGDSLADIEDGRDIGPQQPLEGISRKVLQGHAMLHTGIVDEDIDPADLCLEGINGRAHLGTDLAR